MTWDYYELKKAFGKGKCEVKKCDAHSCRSNTKQDIRGQNASQGYCRLDVITIDSKGKCEQFKPPNQGSGKGKSPYDFKQVMRDVGNAPRDIRQQRTKNLKEQRMNR
jgi:hypothetical protein|tara:strand:- start:4110 stop:4430 length:321 start_codon:yes stop_codon:yes gene_type:complete